MALTPETFDVVLDLPAEDERILRYLKGETIGIGKGNWTERMAGCWCVPTVFRWDSERSPER